MLLERDKEIVDMKLYFKQKEQQIEVIDTRYRATNNIIRTNRSLTVSFSLSLSLSLYPCEI